MVVHGVNLKVTVNNLLEFVKVQSKKRESSYGLFSFLKRGKPINDLQSKGSTGFFGAPA